MALIAPMIKDERGRAVPVVRELARAPMWPWKTPPRRLVSAPARRWMLISGWTGLAIIALAVVVCIVAATASGSAAANVAVGVLVIFAVAYVVVGFLQSWHWTGPGRQAAARAMALGGTCPSCGYGIAGVPRGDHGLTACPECASLWRVG